MNNCYAMIDCWYGNGTFLLMRVLFGSLSKSDILCKQVCNEMSPSYYTMILR